MTWDPVVDPDGVATGTLTWRHDFRALVLNQTEFSVLRNFFGWLCERLAQPTVVFCLLSFFNTKSSNNFYWIRASAVSL
jgi:hypothetical protein